MIAKLSRSIIEKLNLDYLHNQVLKNAYGNDDTVIARLDPRILLAWYGFFGIIPWFVGNVVFLALLFLFVAVTTKLAKIAPLVLVLFCIGVVTQSGYLLLVSLFFGGDVTTVVPVLVLTLKVAVVSLASITVFSGLDPDRLANGLLWYGCPDQFSFSISFGYRILPILMEEFQNILLSYRLRGKAPKHVSLFGKIKYLIYQIKTIILSFYPLMLNTAKRSRTTVEALELKGYRYSISNKQVKKLKLAMLQVSPSDYIFICCSIIWVLGSTMVAMLV